MQHSFVNRFRRRHFITSFDDFEQKLIKITDRTLDVVFSRCMCFSVIMTLRQKPKKVMRSRRRTGSLSVL